MKRNNLILLFCKHLVALIKVYSVLYNLFEIISYLSVNEGEEMVSFANMREEFQKCLKRVNIFLKFLGLILDRNDDKMSMLKRLRNHPIYSAHLISLNFEVSGEVFWFLDALLKGKSFLEITYLIPCLTLCLLSNFKSFAFLYSAHHLNELIDAMRTLQSNHIPSEKYRDIYEKKLTEEHVSMLISITNIIVYLMIMGVMMFAFVPLFIIIPHYYNTGEVKLILPFIATYPFNEFDLRIYPCIYIHQLWTATVVVLMVFGPDCFFFTCCTFTQMQFLLLQYDMERIISKEAQKCDKSRLRELAIRHIELMRCVNLLEKIFSKSMLFNALTSSVIICVTGFNVLEVDNVVIMCSFTAFLLFGLVQIFLYCYYGDTIMRSSMEVGVAIYKTHWYNIKASERKSFFIILIRSQKPCTLTAYGFFNMNLSAFTSILSTSWSYFALLKTIYYPE